MTTEELLGKRRAIKDNALRVTSFKKGSNKVYSSHMCSVCGKPLTAYTPMDKTPYTMIASALKCTYNSFSLYLCADVDSCYHQLRKGGQMNFSKNTKLLTKGSDSVTDVDQRAEIKRNLQAGLVKLSQDFMMNAESGTIKIEDTKDLKDIATVYQAIMANEVDSSNTPTVNAGVVNFYNEVGGGNEDTSVSDRSVVKNIEGMSEEELDEMLAQHDKAQDKSNEEAWED